MSHEVQTINRVRDQARRLESDLAGFDYTAPAELFLSRSKKIRGPGGYKRFDSAAEALRFAIETAPASALLGAYLEVEEARFGQQEIRYLYEGPAYPLKRAVVKSSRTADGPLP